MHFHYVTVKNILLCTVDLRVIRLLRNSQAGRRRFDPGRPLQTFLRELFKSFQSFKSFKRVFPAVQVAQEMQAFLHGCSG